MKNDDYKTEFENTAKEIDLDEGNDQSSVTCRIAWERSKG